MIKKNTLSSKGDRWMTNSLKKDEIQARLRLKGQSGNLFVDNWKFSSTTHFYKWSISSKIKAVL